MREKHCLVLKLNSKNSMEQNLHKIKLYQKLNGNLKNSKKKIIVDSVLD